MSLVHPQLTAFSAVLEEGSFEAAAHRLSVTQSAVSQRIKALEDRLGQVLIVRESPCRPTPAGEQLLRRVLPMKVLESEVLDEFHPVPGTNGPRAITLAVNDDSLATWVIPALAALHHRYGYLLDVRVDDQDHTVRLLQNGSVLGAITSQARAVQGCNVHPLGRMRYLAIAAPDFARHWFGEGVNAASLAIAPMLTYNRKDELQARYIRRITRARLAPPIHYLPSSLGFVAAAAAGLGWCLVPDAMARPALQAQRIVSFDPGRHIDVPLYWQYSALRSTTLQQVTQAIRDAAATMLHG